jgi:hypothetical protein
MSTQWFKSYQYLSEADLQKLSFWTEDFPETNPEAFKDILFQHGAEVSQEIECVTDTHRMRTSNQTHTGKRWVFVERQDREYLNSGIASMEAWIASADISTREDMMNMSRRYQLPSKKEKESEV